MSKATAIVSIYNSKQFIRHKILNLLDQTVPIQTILIDCTNGEELRTVSDLINKPQFTKVIYPQRISIWHAINVGIKMAETPYIVQSNTDDLLHPKAFEKQIKKLEEGFDIAYFDFAFVHEFRKTWCKAFKKSYEIYKVPKKYGTGKGLGAFPMWRKTLHDKYGLFNDKLEIYGDALFWDKLSRDPDIKWGRIQETLGAYAIRNNNLEKNSDYQKHDHEILFKRGK
jgi:glycosyltransferase involved in cell wall biosynthesis